MQYNLQLTTVISKTVEIPDTETALKKWRELYPENILKDLLFCIAEIASDGCYGGYEVESVLQEGIDFITISTQTDSTIDVIRAYPAPKYSIGQWKEGTTLNPPDELLDSNGAVIFANSKEGVLLKAETIYPKVNFRESISEGSIFFIKDGFPEL